MAMLYADAVLSFSACDPGKTTPAGPDAALPDAARPDAALPDAAFPDAAGGSGGSGLPDAGLGGAGQGGKSGTTGGAAGAGQAGAGQAGAGQAGAGQAGQGGASQGGASQGGASQGGASQGGAGQAGTNQGGAGQAGMGQAGAAGATALKFYTDDAALHRSVVLSGDRLYFSTAIPEQIRSIKTDGTGFQVVAEVAAEVGDSITEMTLTGASLLWLYQGKNSSMTGAATLFPLPAGPPKVIGAQLVSPGGLSTDGVHGFWGNGSTLARVALDGTSQQSVPLSPGTVFVPSSAVDDQFVYWAEGTPAAPRLLRTAKNFQGPPQVLADTAAFQGERFIHQILVDGENLFLATDDLQFSGRILRIKKDGSGPLENVVEPTQSAPYCIATDATHIYWGYRTDATPGGFGIWRAPKGATGVARQQVTPTPGGGGGVSGLVLSSDTIYWLEAGGSFFKVLKP